MLSEGYMSDRDCCARVCTVQLQMGFGLQETAAEVDPMLLERHGLLCRAMLDCSASGLRRLLHMYSLAGI